MIVPDVKYFTSTGDSAVLVRGESWRNIDLHEAKLIGCWLDYRDDLSGANLSEADLTGGTFK
jgi:uncharacterized protein YjbI with pentapeptide repeats